jgi:hypothetical protein
VEKQIEIEKDTERIRKLEELRGLEGVKNFWRA